MSFKSFAQQNLLRFAVFGDGRPNDQSVKSHALMNVLDIGLE